MIQLFTEDSPLMLLAAIFDSSGIAAFLFVVYFNLLANLLIKDRNKKH